MAEKMSYADKPWLKSYKLGPYKLPETLQPYPKKPLYQILDDSASRYPDSVAVNFLGKQMKYEELKLNADRLATALADLGVRKGDKVAVVLPNCPHFIISEFGILKAGAVIIPCSIMLKAHHLEYEMSESGAETVICSEDTLDLVNSVKDKTKLRNTIVVPRKDYALGEPEAPKDMSGVLQFWDLIEKYEPKPPEVQIDPMEDLAILAFTGGATGVPKGVMLTHFNVVTNLLQGLAWLMSPLEPGIRGKSSTLLATPLFHRMGEMVMEAGIFWALQILLIADPRDTDSLVQYLKEYRPFMTMLVPTQLMRLAERKVGRMPIQIMTGAAPLPRETAETIKRDLQMPVSEGYGLTETTAATHLNVSAFSKITGFMASEKLSIGIPVPDTEVKIVDPGTDEEVPFGEAGEIWIRGPQVMKGYWPTPGSGLVNGWLATGDVGRMDEDGYFYILDRVKDMANVSGYKVYTTQIDDVLFKHPAVAMAVAIGIPDPERPGSERIKAFIKLKEGYEGRVTADEIIEFCQDKVEPYARPKSVEFRDDLPETVTLKLFKRELREEEIKKMKERGELK